MPTTEITKKQKSGSSPERYKAKAPKKSFNRASATKKKAQGERREKAQGKSQQKKGKNQAQSSSHSYTVPAKKAVSRRPKSPAAPLRIIMLGGLNEIGKNLTVFEYQNDIIVLDCGIAFPDDEMLGIDVVLPDFTYLIKNADKIRGIILTHGHEDHIGALPYLLKSINIPIYGTKLTIGLVGNKLAEHKLLGSAKLNVVSNGSVVRLGCMSAEFIHVNHSIPDACGFAIRTPVGTIVHTGDFKVDYTPIEGGMIDLARFAQIGSEGVLALMTDSTNAERPGYTDSERHVGESFEPLFQRAEGRRIIIATFASNIHRIQQIIDVAEKYGRKVAVSGRSMIATVETAIELGYLTVPENILVDIDSASRLRADEMVIVTTGSQGEPMSALSRMSSGDHRQVSVNSNDFIIISATPIPGNEKLVGRVINELMKLGAEVIYEKMYEVHVSGHACKNELQLMIGLVKPKFYIPVHGEYKHLCKNAQIAENMGIPPENIVISDLGKVIELSENKICFKETVQAGKVLVDGLGVGDVGSIVLRDRKHLAEDGLIIVAAAISSATGRLVSGPDIISRGFVYVRESEELMDSAREVAKNAIENSLRSGSIDWPMIKTNVREALASYVFQKTKRHPMILPIIINA
ncbi:MAG: ribonuclease J [Oscillospiraceae bacterium]|nr:ribonuclease J [Oscillospiraceae bacterium]